MPRIPFFPVRTAIAASFVVTTLATACAAQRAGSPLMMASVGDDAAVALAFHVLLDDVIGDSADKICLSVVSGGAETDPSPGVLRTLRAHSQGEPAVLPRSTCAEDERNFGNPRGLLRLRDVSRADQQTVIAHADAVGDHTARYECIIPDPASADAHARCRIVSRD